MATTFRIRPENIERLRRRFAEAPKTFYTEMHRALKLSGQDFEREMAKRTRGKTREDGLAKRTGALAKSISSKTTGEPPNIASLKMRAVSAGVKYAAIHEFGGVVRPKNAKHLTIPIDDNLTATGDVRYPSARELFRTGSNGRKPFTFKTDRAAYIVLPTEDDLKFLWKLAKSVEIKPRLGFFDAWKKQAPQRRRRFRGALVAAVRGGRA